MEEELHCPQLPKTSPKQLSWNSDKTVQYSFRTPPLDWTCAPELYYELGAGSSSPVCDCGCGVIDPVLLTRTI